MSDQSANLFDSDIIDQDFVLAYPTKLRAEVMHRHTGRKMILSSGVAYNCDGCKRIVKPVNQKVSDIRATFTPPQKNIIINNSTKRY